jgi:murein DD-endopeptidase MepM/ murein hydrolase activator NlpD
MSEKNGRLGWKDIRLNDKYHFGMFNDTSYEQLLHIRCTGRGLVIATAITIFVLITLTTILIAFTPLRGLIPGYPDREMRRLIQMNMMKADSLEHVLEEWAHYLNNSIKIISGSSPQIVHGSTDSDRVNKSFKDERSKEDSAFRKQIESENMLDFKAHNVDLPSRQKDLSEIYFMTPMKGNITARFSIVEGHFGTDIVSLPNDIVKSTLDGTVIMAEWTLKTGNVIQIQHDNDIVSIYKHNAKLLKKQGSKVKAGDAIAIVGNSGELTSGQHLHFELWYKGVPIDPEQYILF